MAVAEAMYPEPQSETKQAGMEAKQCLQRPKQPHQSHGSWLHINAAQENLAPISTSQQHTHLCHGVMNTAEAALPHGGHLRFMVGFRIRHFAAVFFRVRAQAAPGRMTS